jgi:hypothetical protein
LKVSEPTSRWADKKSELLSHIANVGFSLVGEIEESSQFMYITAIKVMEE